MSLQENDSELADREKKATCAVYTTYSRNKLEELPDKVSLTRFNEIYNCLWKKPKKSSEKVFGVFKGIVKKTLLEEINSINKELDIEEKLKARDLLCAEYSDQKDVIQWRPNGSVEETLVSHDMEEMLKRRNLLENVVSRKMKEVEQLKTQLEKNHSKLKKSEKALDETIEDYKHKYSNEVKYSKCLRLMVKEDTTDLLTPSTFFDLKYIRSPSRAKQDSQTHESEEKFRRKYPKESIVNHSSKLKVHKNKIEKEVC